jgi:FMN reductase
MITVINGNPRVGSRTGRLAVSFGNALAAHLDAPAPQVADLATLGYRLLVAGDITRRLALSAIETADVLVVATPTYKGSYTGILKVLLDALPHDGLAGKTAIPLVTAGTQAQADLAVRRLSELLSELGATVQAPAFAIVDSTLGDLDALGADLAIAAAETRARTTYSAA